MNIKTLFGATVLGALVLASPPSHAAVCNATPNSLLQDPFYSAVWFCDQGRINDMWSRFSFNHDDWDQGFGFEDVCNDGLPLKRAFNALHLLAYGVATSPTCNTGVTNVAHWAYCWAGNVIDELDGRCGTGTSRAFTKFGPVIDNYTELYMPFFYNETVVQRAGTIFHEARHAQGYCQHTDSCLDGKESCDPNWANGCVGVGSSSGLGANGYKVVWLAWFTTTARPEYITNAIRANGVAEGNMLLTRRFGTDPCFRFASNGNTFATC